MTPLFFRIFISLSILGIFFLKVAPKSSMPPKELASSLFSDAIISSKRIEIPNIRTILNPSLISYEEGYLLSFRTRKRGRNLKNLGRVDTAFIGVVKLDRDFNIMPDSTNLLEIYSHSSKISNTAEDARLIQIGDRLFIFFNDLPLGKKSGFAVYVAELQKKGDKFFAKGKATQLYFEKAISIEKNWSPFVFEDKCYVIYSDQPRIILGVDLDTGKCTEVSLDESVLDWKWGRIRGGTPAYFLDGQFVTFFHSSFPSLFLKKGKEKKKLVYVMGMYLFDAKPPFTIRSIVPFPLGNVSDYSFENNRQVVFPCGLVLERDVFHVAWGKNNRQVWITTFDQKKLKTNLKVL